MKSLEKDQQFLVRVMLLPLIAVVILTIGLTMVPTLPSPSSRGGVGTGQTTTESSGAQTQLAQSVDVGQAIFQEKCLSCHTIGGGTLVGPDLQGVTARRERDWLARWISTPDKMLAQKDPLATQLFQEYNGVPMPNPGLTDAQVASLIAYLEVQASSRGSARRAGGGAAPQPQPAQALLPGDPMLGKELFTGMMRFQNGGPPCMACHTIAGIGALGGGVLGPDLTTAFNKYNGVAGLTPFLADLPTVTMNAVWGQKLPTEQEQADLVAFLEEASVAQRAPQTLGQLALLAGAGTVVLLGLAQVIWRRRLTEVRRPMLSRQPSAVRGQ